MVILTGCRPYTVGCEVCGEWNEGGITRFNIRLTCRPLRTHMMSSHTTQYLEWIDNFGFNGTKATLHSNFDRVIIIKYATFCVVLYHLGIWVKFLRTDIKEGLWTPVQQISIIFSCALLTNLI